MQHLDTRAGRVSYREAGTGVPVVLLHATLHDHRDFDPVFAQLALQYRTIAVDWPGHGESDLPAPPMKVGAPLFADVLEDVVAALDLPASIFIGNSVGGFAAARLAITHPQCVAGLVLVNSGGFLPNNLGTRMFCKVMGTPALARRILPRFIESYMKPRTANDREVTNRAVNRAKSRQGADTAAAMWRSFATPEHDLRARAMNIHAPTLIVWGSQDTAIPLRIGRATHAAIAHSGFEILPTGHVVFSSAPDAFLDVVSAFLVAASQSTPPAGTV